MRIVFLGTGTSHGIPVVACRCPVCRSDDPRDRRTRSSILVLGEQGERLLVDAGPEFRLQAVAAGIDRLDAVLLTHAHADHLHGLDDLRPLCRQEPLPVFGNAPTVAELRERFAYIFRETQTGGGKPRIVPLVVEAGSVVVGYGAGDDADSRLRITAIPAKHGRLDILGWLFAAADRRAAYLTDVTDLPEASLAALGNLDLLIVGALRVRPHETHFSFSQAINLAQRLRPRRVLLTHICHEHAHREIEAFCASAWPPGGERPEIGPAYDGLTVSV